MWPTTLNKDKCLEEGRMDNLIQYVWHYVRDTNVGSGMRQMEFNSEWEAQAATQPR